MLPNYLAKHRHTFIAIALFCLTFLIYFYSPNRFIKDSRWAIHVASSIINAGDTNLNEYQQVAADINFSSTRAGNNDQLFSYFPAGNSILIIPFIWIIEQAYQLSEHQSFYQYLQQTSPHNPYLVSIQHFLASVITAMIVPILYYIGYKQFSNKVAIISVLIFAFGTTAYSTASLVLWQHGPSMLMLTITLALFIKGEHDPRAIQWAGIPLAFSFIIRPTNSIPIIIFTLVVFLRHRRQLPGYLLGALVIAIPFFGSNQLVYDSFLPPYYKPQRVGSSPYFTEALAGNLVSPGRGLFVFSPILLFAFYGIYAKFRRIRLTLLECALIAIIGLHWVLISTFAHWWGGGSYGPRLFTDMMPYMTYFLMMGLYELNLSTTQPRFRQIGLTIFTVLAFISITIHYIGANKPTLDQWSRWPVNIETHPSVRLWDWKDILFSRTVEDWPLTTLPTNISFNLQDDSADELIHIPMRNGADNAYLWEIKLPTSLQIEQSPGIDHAYTKSGIPIVVGETALPTQTYQWLPIAIKQSLESFVDPSLGAIMVTTKTLFGEENSVQVIPVSIVNNGRDWRDSDALSKQVWLPADIRINNDKASPMLYGLYGSGWYSLESFEQYQWRWAQSPAELYVFSAKPQSLILELSFNSIHDETHANRLEDTGQLHISGGEEDWTGKIEVEEFHKIPVSLDKGWNTLVFNLESGNFSPAEVDVSSSDKRRLSFSLDSINIVTID